MSPAADGSAVERLIVGQTNVNDILHRRPCSEGALQPGARSSRHATPAAWTFRSAAISNGCCSCRWARWLALAAADEGFRADQGDAPYQRPSAEGAAHLSRSVRIGCRRDEPADAAGPMKGPGRSSIASAVGLAAAARDPRDRPRRAGCHIGTGPCRQVRRMRSNAPPVSGPGLPQVSAIFESRRNATRACPRQFEAVTAYVRRAGKPPAGVTGRP